MKLENVLCCLLKYTLIEEPLSLPIQIVVIKVPKKKEGSGHGHVDISIYTK